MHRKDPELTWICSFFIVMICDLVCVLTSENTNLILWPWFLLSCTTWSSWVFGLSNNLGKSKPVWGHESFSAVISTEGQFIFRIHFIRPHRLGYLHIAFVHLPCKIKIMVQFDHLYSKLQNNKLKLNWCCVPLFCVTGVKLVYLLICYHLRGHNWEHFAHRP